MVIALIEGYILYKKLIYFFNNDTAFTPVVLIIKNQFKDLDGKKRSRQINPIIERVAEDNEKEDLLLTEQSNLCGILRALVIYPYLQPLRLLS